MPLGGRLLASLLGFSLTLLLGLRLRGTPSVRSCILLLSAAWLLIAGLSSIDFQDRLGISAFLLGILAAALTSHSASTSKAAEPWRHVYWLLYLWLFVGVTLGLGAFGLWYWRSSPIDRIEMGLPHALAFSLFGLVAGAGAMLLVIGLGARPGKGA